MLGAQATFHNCSELTLPLAKARSGQRHVVLSWLTLAIIFARWAHY
jgi:hypothetical protein